MATKITTPELFNLSSNNTEATQLPVFTTSTRPTPTASTVTVDYLVVAGGGSGAVRHPGGGGAGGLRTSYGLSSGGGAVAESSLTLNVSTRYTVTIGAGGSSVTSDGVQQNRSGNNGTDSVFGTITSSGGGGGGAYNTNGFSGGSGGGGGETAGSSLSGGSGTTGPHVLMRYFTTASVKAARQSVGWSLVFICLLYLTAPALATFTKLSLLDPNLATGIIGKSFADAQSLEWVQKWTSAGFLKLVDGNGDGLLQLQEFFMNGQIVVLATPEIAGLPYVISGLVAAGGLAAAMSTADGLLLAIANALSHDLYYKIIDPKADSGKRLVVARVLLLAIGAAGAYVAAQKLTGILGAVAWAFCFANSGLFFPLVLGIWWKRANRAGAIAGMIGGLAAGTAYLYAIKWGGMDPWLGIDHLRFGMIGMPVSLILMVVVSK
jgi:hypothetical protein